MIDYKFIIRNVLVTYEYTIKCIRLKATDNKVYFLRSRHTTFNLFSTINRF